MAKDYQEWGEKMARAERAFKLNVIEKKSIRTVAKEMGISPATAFRDIRAYKAYLAARRAEDDLDAKRAELKALLDDVVAKAQDVYRTAKLPLHKVGALNTIIAAMTHYRAIEGADTPKEVRADVGGEFIIRWADDELD